MDTFLLAALLRDYEKEAIHQYSLKYLYPSFEYLENNNNCIFGMMYQMAETVIAYNERDDKKLEEAVGQTMWYLANYAYNNGLNLHEIFKEANFESILNETNHYMFESFAEMHRKEITMQEDMDDNNKILFIKKIFIQCFAPGTPFSFVEMTLKNNIINNTKK